MSGNIEQQCARHSRVRRSNELKTLKMFRVEVTGEGQATTCQRVLNGDDVRESFLTERSVVDESVGFYVPAETSHLCSDVLLKTQRTASVNRLPNLFVYANHRSRC